MSYVTNNDVDQRLGTARYVQLTDDAGTGSADPDVADEARNGAEGEVNGYLSQRYAVPIDLVTHGEVAPALLSVTLDLTEFRLYARRGSVPSNVIAKRDAAVDWLRRVADGRASLPSVNPIASNPAAGLRAASTGDERMLSRDELSDF